jgi:diamine N-acetyltransferase
MQIKEFMTAQIEIVEVALADISALQAIGRQTFVEAFAQSNTPENMQKYLAEGFSTEKLTAELSNPDSKFYFATFENNVIGYLKINFGEAQTELKEQKALEIERIYVLKAFYGQKVGQILYEIALDVAQKINADYVWLGVWEENHRAMSFYKKNGFAAFGKHIFKLGEEEQTDIMMKLQR